MWIILGNKNNIISINNIIDIDDLIRLFYPFTPLSGSVWGWKPTRQITIIIIMYTYISIEYSNQEVYVRW